MGRFSFALAGAALACSGPALAQGRESFRVLQLARQADKLKPGEWVSKPEIARDGPVLVYVDLGRQLATVYRNGVRIGVSTISSGKDGYSTPTGVFTILEKDKDHRSRTHDNAPMPYQQRLTWKGVAMHAGNLPGFPASHGCVRLPMEFAKKLFDATPMGGTVVIAGGQARTREATRGGRAAPVMEGGAGARDAASHKRQVHLEPVPERRPARCRSSSRPATSRWWSPQRRRNRPHPCRRRAETDETQVLTPRAGRRPEWIQVGVSNLTGEPAEIISTEASSRCTCPKLS